MASLSIRNLDDELVEQLKDLTGEATASKALIGAAELALQLKEENRAEHELAEYWYEQAQVARRVIREMVPQLTQALEVAGQSDLFQEEAEK